MKVVVIGGDAAGMSAASQVKRQKPDSHVIVFEKGRYISYAACGIPYYVGGAVPAMEELIELTPDEVREKRRIDLRLRHEVTQILPEDKKVIVQSGGELWEESYDKLMIATGASPNRMGTENLQRVFTAHDLEEAGRIMSFLDTEKPSRVAVLGGGYIGLEMAEAFRERGTETIMIHRRDRLQRSFEPELSDMIRDKLVEKGVILKFGSPIQDILEQRKKVLVQTEAEMIEADMLVLAVGVFPNSELAAKAGIALGTNGAIQVNEFLETSCRDIYAAGDCATTGMIGFDRETYTALALKANKQGMIGGINMAGGRERVAGVLNSAVTRIFDLGAACTGLTFAEAEEMGLEPEKIIVKSRDRARYFPSSSPLTTLLTVSRRDRRILGAQLAGKVEAVKRIDTYSVAIHNRMTVDQLFDLDLAYAPPFSPVYDPVLLAARVARKKVGHTEPGPHDQTESMPIEHW